VIHLVNVPFGSIMRAPLALGLIKAQLAQAGIAARTHNVNFLFGRVMGFGAYETIARFKGVETQISEWLFAEAAWRQPFGPNEDDFLRQCGDELDAIPHVTDPVAWFRKLRRETVDVYLEKCCLRLFQWGPPKVVAFSCMFFQTTAALALGRRIKEQSPETKLVYGGACFHGEAGQELIEKVPWIDVVAVGEADAEIVPLFAALERGELPRELPGVIVRDANGVIAGPPTRPASAATLEALPDPDYTEFFEDAGKVGLLDDAVWLDRASLPFEASRGCWWGQKKHCTFCGLNGDGMEFRVKSAERVLATLARLSRYPTRNLQATDNIMAMSYWKSLLPVLADQPLMHASGKKIDLFFEIKPNLTRAQIKALAEANVVYVQPGIESLSTHLLKAVDKGVTALQNVFFLKCATEYGLLPIWNVLIRIPGEAAEDYAEMSALIPRLLHLRPPTGGAPRVEVHRYSPYFERAGVFVDELRPAAWYHGVYPDHIDLGRVAYYFEATWKHTLGGATYDELIDRTHTWMRRWAEPAPPRLTMRDVDDDALEIEDTRGKDPVVWRLEGRQARLYRQLADITTPEKVHAAVGTELTVDEIRGELLGFVAEGLAMREHDRFLGLAIPPIADAPLIHRVVRRMTNQGPVRVAPRTRLPVVTS